MKTANIFFLLQIGLFFFSYTQNWNLVNPAYAYHYVESSNPDDSLNAITIRVEKENMGDYELNLKIEISDPIWQNKTWVNLPFFLQKEMIDQSKGKKWFRDPHSFVLFEENIPQNWLFDTLNVIEAEIFQVYQTEIYGQLDSLRSILLSTGDTIIQSKTYGLIRFPNFEETNVYYQQIGIKDPNVGFQFPEIEDFFDFAVGDKFEYKILEIDSKNIGQEDGRRITTEIIKQTEIVDINSSQSGEKNYTIKESSITKSHTFSYWTGISGDSIEVIKANKDSSFVVDSIPFSKWNNNFASSDLWDRYPGELFFYNENPVDYPVTSISYSNSDICGTRINRTLDLDNCFAFVTNFVGRDSISFDCESSVGTGWSGYANWATDLGITNVYFRIKDGNQGDYSYSDSLIAFQKNGITCGTFTTIEPPEEENPVDTTDSVHQYIYPFINPSPETINIFPHPDFPSTTFSLIDLRGREVLSMEIQGNEPVIVNLPRSLRGLYIARFSGPSSEILTWYKMIIE